MGDGIRLRTLPDGRTVVETSEGLHVIVPGTGMRLAYPGYQLGLTRTNPCSCDCCGGHYRED